jgi:abortive infection bacteriophage resistance protein
MKYSKPALSIDDQIQQIIKRGITINNIGVAKSYLRDVGYYRLSGYWWPMLADKNTKTFKTNSTFENVIDIYNFDRELRILLFDIIEKIEIAFRTKLIYHLSSEISPWWFEDSQNFNNSVKHNETITAIDRELQQTKENFIIQHRLKYHTDTRRPPAWKTLEIASLGSISKLYGNLKNQIKSKDIIAQEFGTINHTYLPSWIQSISQIRNIIAHHGRLWNKNLPGRPKLLSKPPNSWCKVVPPVNEHQMLYVHLCCMKYLLNTLVDTCDMTSRLMNLLNKYNNIDAKALGLKLSWENEPLWKNF